MRSMTGFGVGDASWEGGRFEVSVRTVNHRHLDVVLRLPPELVAEERRVRERVRDFLHRGRVEVVVEEWLEGSEGLGELDLEAARRLAAYGRDLVDAGLAEAGLGAADLLQHPGVLRRPRRGTGSGDGSRGRALHDALQGALAAAEETRVREGRSLAQELLGIVDRLDDAQRAMTTLQDSLRHDLLGRYRERIRSMLENSDLGADGVSEARILQEAGVLAERADLAEEVARLRSHLVAVREALEADGAVGRRLDFLAQEMLREINTIGSKSRDADLSARVVDAKVACEQFREQVQNVE